MDNRTCVRAVIRNGDKLLAMKRNKFGVQYYALVGGGVEAGEDTETALRRELREETGLEVGAVRLVWVEDPGEPYGEQYIYLCEYIGGEPQLAVDSEEAADNIQGQNTYVPLWLPIADLPGTAFKSDTVKTALTAALASGFPETPVRLA